MAQSVPSPNLERQRDAMSKLRFLVGRWVGEARLFRGQDQPLELTQTEEAQYKLDGLILLIEGISRSKLDGKPLLQALGIICYDDLSSTYHMRAFNDGRFLETEVALLGEGKGLRWGFALGEVGTTSVLRINRKGEWTELTEVTVGSQPPRKLMELAVRRVD
jgi:hypothetical protein